MAGTLMGIFSGIASLISGSRQRRSERRAQERNVREQRRVDAINWQRQEMVNERNYQRSRPINQVREMELAGINPIAGMGNFPVAQGAATQDSSVMLKPLTDPFANAGAIFAQHLDGHKEAKVRATRAEYENQLLKKEIDNLATPSPTPHIERYGHSLPTYRGYHRRASGDAVGGLLDGVSDGYRSLDLAKFVFPDRDVERDPVKDLPGGFILDSKITDFLGGPYWVAGDEGDAYDWGQLSAIGAQIAPQILWEGVKNEAEFVSNVVRHVPRVVQSVKARVGDARSRASDVQWHSGIERMSGTLSDPYLN